MPRLVVHIGLEKTGSTYIQAFLRDNAAMLGASGIGYPDFCRGPEHLEVYMAAVPGINWMHRRFRISTEEAADALRRDVGTGFARMAAAHETSVVTCERLSVLRAPEALDGLARLAGEHFDRVEVVAFLRRPDHAVGSYYGQAVKAGMSSRDAAQFVAKQARPLDLHAVMRRWQKVFGEDAVRAWPYLERYKSDRDAGLEVLFHHLGIASPRGDARWASPDRPVNVRLSAEATEYVRLLNPRVPRWRVDGSWNGTQRNALLREVSARFPGTDAAAPPDVVAAVVTAFPAEPVVDLFRGSADADAAALWDEWLDQPAGQGAEPPSLSAAQVDALAAQVFAPAGPVVADGALPRRLARAAAATTSAASATSGSSLTRAVRRRLGRLRRRLTQGRPQG